MKYNDEIKISIKPAHSDERGDIIDILYNTSPDHVGIVTLTTNSIRGNHFHKETTQTNYLISGKIEYHCSDENGDNHEYCVMNKGDLSVSKPNQIHSFVALEDSEMLVMSRGSRGGEDYESDTFRKKII